MSGQFIDTNVLLYAHDKSAGPKHTRCIELLSTLMADQSLCMSLHVLSEFYAIATKKLAMPAVLVESIVLDFETFNVYAPRHADLITASRLHRKASVSWWDALIVTSAQQLGCSVLWTEDLQHNQRFGSLTVKNPFR